MIDKLSQRRATLIRLYSRGIDFKNYKLTTCEGPNIIINSRQFEFIVVFVMCMSVRDCGYRASLAVYQIDFS